MHRLESGVIVKLFTPQFINSNRACRKAILFLCVSQSVFGDQIFVNIQEGFALIYRLCLRSKDIFAEDGLHKSYLCCILLIRFIVLWLFHNKIRGSIFESFGNVGHKHN